MAVGEVRIRPLAGVGEIAEGDELGRLVAEAGAPLDGEIVVLSQKAVSKAEGRVRRLDRVDPAPEARDLAARLGKDPRLVELVLAESAAVIRAERGVLITETTGGWICANAGIDSSNVGRDGTRHSAAGGRRRVGADESAPGSERPAGSAPGVVIADSFGRPWRRGQADVAIGCAGVTPLDDWRGRRDRDGRELAVTEIAVADELAAAADLVRDKDAGRARRDRQRTRAVRDR